MKSIHLLAAATLIAGGMFALTPAVGDDTVVTGKTAVSESDGLKHKKTISLPEGITQKDYNAGSAIENSLTNLAEDAISKNGFDNLIGYLVDQDRQRLADKKNMKVDDLNALAEKINATWKAKYGQNFKADKKTFDNFLVILTGEVNNPDQLVGKWPVNAGPLAAAVDANAGKVTPSDADQAKKSFGGDVNLEKGRKVAVVLIPTSHGLHGVTASMISEATGWRFDIPNNIDADTLKGNLVKGLTQLSERTEWPADFFEAQRVATHVIVGSLYGVDLSSKIDMKTATEK